MTTERERPAFLDPVEWLLKRGEHAAAATLLLEQGEPARAARILEQIFEHDKAMHAFEAAGDMVSAVRVAIAADNAGAIDRLVGAAIASGQGDPLLSSLLRAGRLNEVGRLHLARGDLAAAARAFEESAALDRAAACYEELGQAREAGIVLERHLDAHPDDTTAALRLGRILARFGRHDDAITMLQRAIHHAADSDVTLVRAAPTMTLAFLALGYASSAEAVLRRWQKAWHRLRVSGDGQTFDSSGLAAEAKTPDNPRPSGHELDEPPQSIDELEKSARGVAFAAVQEKRQVTPSPSTPPSPGASTSGGFDALLGERAEPEAAAVASDVVEASQLLLSGRYLLGEPLGGGGVGQVFRAYDAFTDRPVAVKIFGAQAMQSEAVKAFALEARAASALAHPALARLIELNMGQGFVVTELLDIDTGGMSMEERLRGGGDSGWLVPVARGLLDLLSACHRTGLVHGGLKPTNVFVLAGGMRVVDVGAHRLLALRSTETGGLESVWPYLSPEMLFGAPADVAGDLYAVATMLYRALTGVPPFARAEEDRSVAPPLASTQNAAVPAAWDAFFTRALSPKPAQRFASADDMMAALPVLSSSFVLPASSRATPAERAAIASDAERYQKGALAQRTAGVRVYQGTDALVGRPVWLVEVDDAEALAPLLACARVWRGLQPVYDVLPQAHRAVVARDVSEHVADLAVLRAVPQGLTRDLLAVAQALDAIHGAGFAFDGFDTKRAMGPVGPRLRLAPSPLPVVATNESRARDWQSFAAFTGVAFDVHDDETLDARGRLLAALHDARFLERRDLDFLASQAGHQSSWPEFLTALTERLVLGAQGRGVARLVKSIVKAPGVRHPA